MNRLLDTCDAWAAAHGLDGDLEPPYRCVPTAVDASPALSIDLKRNGIRSVVWATGYRPDYSWLEVPVLDRKGRLVHDGGVVASPGMYVLGLPFLRRRKSALIDGAGEDARELSAHLAHYLAAKDGVGPRQLPDKRGIYHEYANDLSLRTSFFRLENQV
jgi:putative flavoprotein involved in K+ transport